MTRAEIEGYLLHAAAEPGSFVLDEQADRLEAAIKREVLQARVDELKWASDNLNMSVQPSALLGYRLRQFRAELSNLEVPGE